MFEGTVLVTGGAGFLARAIYTQAWASGSPARFIALSRDPVKLQQIKAKWPQIRTVVGDIRNRDALRAAMAGVDLVIHAAAMKHIPEGEQFPADMYEVNVQGSVNVAWAAIDAGVHRVIGISTDKACHPVNTYGCTKLMLERLYQHYDGLGLGTRFHLVRYGNVIGSTASVAVVWRRMLEADGVIRATDPTMTRFWLTDKAAVFYLHKALEQPHGTVFVPLLGSATMADFKAALFPDAPIGYTGLRPGEKVHEELLTAEELPFAEWVLPGVTVVIRPMTGPVRTKEGPTEPHTSASVDPTRWTAEDIRQAVAP